MDRVDNSFGIHLTRCDATSDKRESMLISSMSGFNETIDGICNGALLPIKDPQRQPQSPDRPTYMPAKNNIFIKV